MTLSDKVGMALQKNILDLEQNLLKMFCFLYFLCHILDFDRYKTLTTSILFVDKSIFQKIKSTFSTKIVLGKIEMGLSKDKSSYHHSCPLSQFLLFKYFAFFNTFFDHIKYITFLHSKRSIWNDFQKRETIYDRIGYLYNLINTSIACKHSKPSKNLKLIQMLTNPTLGISRMKTTTSMDTPTSPFMRKCWRTLWGPNLIWSRSSTIPKFSKIKSCLMWGVAQASWVFLQVFLM